MVPLLLTGVARVAGDLLTLAPGHDVIESRSASAVQTAPAGFLPGVDVPIVSPEDLLIAKLEWSQMCDSTLQRRDVQQLLERMGGQLDHAYVEEWVEELGLRAELDRARASLTDAGRDTSAPG